MSLIEGLFNRRSRIGRGGGVGLAVAMLLATGAAAQAQTADVVSRADSLRNAGAFAASAQLLAGHLRTYPTDTRAELMLAEVLYWQGDYSAAARHFRHLLAVNPQNAAARRQLDEIRAASSPWLRMRADVNSDNQPVKRFDGDIDAGFFINPLWSIGLRAAPQHATSGDTTLNELNARGVLKGYVPSAHLDVELSAGTAQWRSARAGTTVKGLAFIGSARFAVPVARNLKLFASVNRLPYTSTIASLAAPITTTMPAIGLQLSGRWLGEAAAQRTSYPDNNAVITTYAWLLAPIVLQQRYTLHLGYALSYQDSKESRYTTAARYDPYFTPENEMQHQAAGSFVTWNKSGTRLQVNGSYAFYGKRTTPSVTTVSNGNGKPVTKVVAFSDQTFHPYDVHAAASFPLNQNVSFTFDAERIRTSFYQDTRVGAQAAIHFAHRPAS